MKPTTCLIFMNIILLNSINAFATAETATHLIGRKTIKRHFGAARDVPSPGWAILKIQPDRPNPIPKKQKIQRSKKSPGAPKTHIVHFDLGSSQLRSAEIKKLYRVANIKGRGPVERVTGYTCPAGDWAVNKRLARDRARTVAAWLKDQDITVRRILAKPKCCYVSRTDPAANRRVEIIFSTQDH